METVLESAFVPHVLVLASEDCRDELYRHPALVNNLTINSEAGPICLCSFDQVQEADSNVAKDPDIEKLVIESKKNSTDGNFLRSIIVNIARETVMPNASKSFESFGHPIACILAVSSSNSSPISALTQLYQQSFANLPPHIAPDFLRCVWYIEDDKPSQGEDFDTVFSQFGPHCFKTSTSKFDETAIETANQSVYPYMEKLVHNWQAANNGKSSNSGSFGFGKFLKKLVQSGPPRPDFNLFFDVCKEMQPHVASIPAPRKPGLFNNSTPSSTGPNSSNSNSYWIDMQVRRLADTALMLREYKLALSAYESLRKPFLNEQRWAERGAACEMVAVLGALLKMNDISSDVDNALYTYTSRVPLPGHFLRCVLLVSACLVQNRDQLLAAGLLSNALLEVDPVFGTGSEPAEAAMLMEQIAHAFENRNWQRKAELWHKLADSEWKRSSL